MRKTRLLWIALLVCQAASLASGAEQEHPVVIEMAGAGEWGFHGGSAYGPEIGVEFTVIERMLEIGIGVTPLFSRGQAEIGTELTFKKPFELTKQLELLIGAGPEWIHRPDGEGQRNSIAGVVLLDLVYSPWPKQPVAFFIEPSYSYDFGKGHEQAVGVTIGLHISIK